METLCVTADKSGDLTIYGALVELVDTRDLRNLSAQARNPYVESPKFGGKPLDKYDGPQVAKVKRLTYAVKCLKAV